MKNKKKKKLHKDRNCAAVAAWSRNGAGTHKVKKRYNRKRNKKVIADES